MGADQVGQGHRNQSILGLRASILADLGSAVPPRRAACLTTIMAPVIRRRLRSR